MKHFVTLAIIMLLVLAFASLSQAQIIYQDDFEGSGNINWQPLFYNNTNAQWEEGLTVMANPFGSGNVGMIEDADTSYTGAALVGGDVFGYAELAIEADVYCYVDVTPGAPSRYTGVVLMADTSLDQTTGEIHTRYVKLVADFDDNFGSGPRLRLYNNDLNMTTFTYSFDVKFYASDIPGGIPSTDGWHKLRLEAKTINADSVAYWVYFDGQPVGSGPVYDYTHDVGGTMHYPYTPGTFGLFAFRQGDPLPGYFDNVKVEQLAVGIPDNPQQASGFQLQQNYPNPFNPTTEISFSVPGNQPVQLLVFNSLGQKIRTLLNGSVSAGTHRVRWDARDDRGNLVPAGIYYYRLNAGDFSQTRKMLLVK